MWKRYLLSLVTLTILGVALGSYFEQYEPPDRRVSIELETDIRPVAPAFSRSEISCLAKIVFNESRNQRRDGQLAVAAVVINRSLSPRFKATDLCGVSSQRGQFANHRPDLRNAIERRAMDRAIEVAEYVTQNYGSLDPKLREFLYFNSNKAKRGAVTIQDHHFYVSLSSRAAMVKLHV